MSLATSTAWLAQFPATAGLVPLATGLFRFCQAYTLLGISTCSVRNG